MKPQQVEVTGGKAYIYGIPDEGHSCDEWGCPSIAHVISCVPIISNDGSTAVPQDAVR